MAENTDKYVVLYFETDGCTDPKLMTAPVDLDTARAKLKELWEADLNQKGYKMPKANEYGALYSRDAYLSSSGCEATSKPYTGAKYKHKWLVLKVPTK